MTNQPRDFRDRITVDPGILAGKPVVTGTRIPVSLILNLLSNGYDIARIRETYPILTVDDVKAAIDYASARVDREEVRLLAD